MMLPTLRREAAAIFAERPEIASVSVVPESFVRRVDPSWQAGSSRLVHAAVAAWPACVFNPGVSDLIAETVVDEQSPSAARIGELAAAATLKGLSHVWLIVSDDEWSHGVAQAAPAPSTDRVVIAALGVGTAAPAPLSLGIDASWLLGGESGAQVFVFEMLREMVRRPEVRRVILLSDSGGIPAALAGTPKISGMSWPTAVSSGARLDILHRPYQPGEAVDLDLYRSIANAVAITVLDFIAYDNPSYHESPFAWRAYQRAFDEKICDADQVFAISRHVGERLQRQFAHRLLAPVRSIHLGADHLDAANTETAVPPSLSAVTPKQYLAVLGNDFAHKNRDFAVRVFAEMCRRGYQGRLVLAGFHLDAGSSYSYELDAAAGYRDRVLRVGPLASDHKTWLLRNAAAVLYPTSSEGFGLIAFEAAALGTPTAFVRFGALGETMPGVPAATTWQVKGFADHVFSLLDNPAGFVAAVHDARRLLTWERCAAETIAVYHDMLRDSATWHASVAAGRGPGVRSRLNETAAEFWRRVGGRVRRLTGRAARERK